MLMIETEIKKIDPVHSFWANFHMQNACKLN